MIVKTSRFGWALSLLFLHGCGLIQDPGDVTRFPDYESYTGREYFALAFNPNSTNCELTWDAEATARNYNCPNCVFAFDVQMTYSAADSTDDGTCVQRQVDFTTSYVLLINDDYGSDYALATLEANQLDIFATAQFSENSGQFSYASFGTATYVYSYYYLYQTSGIGDLVEIVSEPDPVDTGGDTGDPQAR